MASCFAEELPQNNKVVKKYKRKFPKEYLFKKNISNAAILNAEINAAFTIHGTCINEFVYLGLPIVASGAIFHAGKNFYFLPQNLKKHLHIKRWKFKNKDKKNIEKFVFMNYFRYQDFSKNRRLFLKAYKFLLPKNKA